MSLYANPHLLTPEDLAQMFRVKVTTIRAWRKRGLLPPGEKFGRLIRWHRADIERFRQQSR